MTESVLPEGVLVRDLVLHEDPRGELRELYRDAWAPTPAFLQWNMVRSRPDVLRGVHAHPRHADYLHVIAGEMRLGLHDLRPERAEDRLSCILTLTGDRPRTVFIPPGVAHGFHFPMETLYIYGLSTGWSMDEEMGCLWNDPGLGLDWGVSDPLLSTRDAAPEHDYAGMRFAWMASQGAA